MKVRFWGVRGSIPVPGKSTNRYGGNTSCVEVRPEGAPPIIIDAGTGIRRLGKSLMEDVRFRDRLSRLEVELMALEITNLRFLDRMRRTGQPPGADVSMLKIKGTEIQQGLTELAMECIDPLAGDETSMALQKKYLTTRKTTIYAGSNEIQRNIIAKMTLGL